MRQKLIPIFNCPKCKSSLKLKIDNKTRERINNGKLWCKKCNSLFEIIDDIVCFRKITKHDKDKKKFQDVQKMFLEQELKRKWLKNFNKQEFSSLKNEWGWLINNLDLQTSKVHLDWATGTGRFLRNILNLVKREIIVLDIDYPTCLGLKMFLKKINKYSRVTIIYGDAISMPFSNNSIDSISSWHGLDEPNVNKAIDESQRVLKINKVLALSGLFYKKGSKSLEIALKSKIEFAQEDKAYQCLKKLGFKDIDYKIFFTGKWLEHGSFLPRYGDDYSCYGVRAKKE